MNITDYQEFKLLHPVNNCAPKHNLPIHLKPIALKKENADPAFALDNNKA
jgi:hypothetical protein